MRVRVGFGIGGSVFGGEAGEGASLGAPTWGPLALLRDLELRLGLPPVDAAASVRLPRWTARIASLADAEAFYRRSFEVDKLGTAAALLEWRDGLVEAGWDGTPIPGGGARIDALARIEAHERQGMPLGDADRLARAEEALARAPSRVYEAIELLDEAALWPARWRRIFDRLAATGTSVTLASFELPGAPGGSDLATLQALLRGEKRTPEVRGDGTLLLLRGDTPVELAELTASLLANGRRAGRDEVVVRSADAATLEAALPRHGLPAQGHAGASAWRPAMQVLPLAIELAFEPRDPYRVLELLTLPVGPFGGVVGARLARAVARQPGVGGKEWALQKEEATKRLRDRHVRLALADGKAEAEAEEAARAIVDERLRAVAEWLEAPGADPSGATRAALRAVAERVRSWIQRRLRSGELDVYGAAYAQTEAFAEALAHDTREVLSQEDVRQLLDRFARTEQAHAASVEVAGRVGHVDHPASLLAPCDGVFFWGFIAGVERRPPRLPWNDAERTALAASAVVFPDPASLLAAEAARWRRAVLAARGRVVFVVPRTIKGTPAAPHPLWDEVSARLRLDETSAALVTRDVRAVLERGALVEVDACVPLRLPEPRASWTVAAGAIHAEGGEDGTSVTSLEKIATCPLAWVLDQRAALRSGAISKVASGPLLNGSLTHRLVEELFAEGAFDHDEATFLERASVRFEELLRTEGATLLLPGASIEGLQVRRQVQQAMRALYRYLVEAGWRIASVEEPIALDSTVGALRGRLDLRLVDEEGAPAILDLKWGASTYGTLLAEGRAVQLAAYARAVGRSCGFERPLPPAGYFALASGRALASDARMSPPRIIEGPSLETTWERVEATAAAVVKELGRGVVHVAGTRHALPLLDALGVPEAERDGHFSAARDAACTYCGYDALCGRKWEALA